MSFARLFASGKGLIGGRYEARYQTDKHFRLPRFISPKNPFARPTTAEDAATPVPAVTEELPRAQVAEPMVEAIPATTPLAPKSLWATLGGRLVAGLVRLLKKLNPIEWYMRPARPAASAIPRFGAHAVQPELHLEKVRVMRNDLCDADLEVVPVGPAATKTVPGGTAWSQLATRVFGTGPTR